MPPAATCRPSSPPILPSSLTPSNILFRVYFGAHSIKSFKRNILRFVGIGPVRETLIGKVGNTDIGKVYGLMAELEELGREGA